MQSEEFRIEKANNNRLFNSFINISDIIFFPCTIFPHIKRSFSLNETIEVPSHSNVGSSASLDKALFANACNKDESYCLKDVILVTGIIDQGTIYSIDKLISKGESDTICFRTPGGNIDAAIAIGEWIDRHNLKTCLAEKYIIKERGSLSSTICASACPFIFAMGEERISIGTDIKVGIHRSGGSIDFFVFSALMSMHWILLPLTNIKRC
ncbi:MAG: hypothetical protein VCA39_07225 [Pseudomonas sp.]|uniref:hypothetical protein n=1 Tax=Pseudomonas sp. TaxID=306 RepID=UPI003981EE9A